MERQGRLLIVDDEQDIREVLRDSLADHVEMIFEAANGEEALEKLKTISVHAILSDISMPNLSGIELLRALRSMGRDTPFIILTGFGDKAQAIEALKLGAFDFLEKPWKETEVVDVVGRAVELGKKMEHWGSAKAEKEQLETVRQETAIQSIRTLEAAGKTGKSAKMAASGRNKKPSGR